MITFGRGGRLSLIHKRCRYRSCTDCLIKKRMQKTSLTSPKKKDKSLAWAFGNLMFQIVIGHYYWIEPYPFSVAFFANNFPNSETILTMLSILIFRKMLKSNPQISAVWKCFKFINSTNINSVDINSRHWGKFCSSVQLKALP